VSSVLAVILSAAKDLSLGKAQLPPSAQSLPLSE